MRRIWSLGALGEGSGWDLRVRPAAASGNLGTWKSGNLEIWGPGNPAIWGPKNKNIKIMKIEIRSAQNVGKVWISREKNLPAPFGALWAQFLRGPEKSKKYQNFAYFPWWALAAIHPWWGYWYNG